MFGGVGFPGVEHFVPGDCFARVGGFASHDSHEGGSCHPLAVVDGMSASY